MIKSINGNVILLHQWVSRYNSTKPIRMRSQPNNFEVVVVLTIVIAVTVANCSDVVIIVVYVHFAFGWH